MSFVEFNQTAEDHCALLVLICPLGTGLKPKSFARTFDRIARVRSIRVGSPARVVALRYRRDYSTENNAWGDFQFHRRVLGLISVGKCDGGADADEGEENDARGRRRVREDSAPGRSGADGAWSMRRLCRAHEELKERYEGTLLDARLLVFGSLPAPDPFSLDPGLTPAEENSVDRSASDDNRSVPKKIIQDPLGSGSTVNHSSDSKPSVDVAGLIIDPLNANQLEVKQPDYSRDTGISVNCDPLNATERLVTGLDDPLGQSLRRIHSDGRLTPKGRPHDTDTGSLRGSPSRRTAGSKPVGKATSKPRGDVWHYAFDDALSTPEFDTALHDYLASLFWVLESKRLDRSAMSADHPPAFIAAPYERRDSFAAESPDSRVHRRRCQGRLRKQLGDICLLTAAPDLAAATHYRAALELLKPSGGDALWVGGAYEGLAVTSVVKSRIDSLEIGSSSSLQRNVSFSVKRGVAAQNAARTFAANAPTTGLDLADRRGSASAASASQPIRVSDQVAADYKDAIIHYGKVREAGVVELEASLKACRVLAPDPRRGLDAADFLQNVVYIGVTLSEEESAQRFATLAQLYADIGMRRKAAFCFRIAAMQCVIPTNPVLSWNRCYRLLLFALPGYHLPLDVKSIPLPDPPAPGEPPGPPGWNSVQLRVLHELVYAARRMANPAVAVRHISYLLHVMHAHLRDTERTDLCAILRSYTCDPATTATSIALEDGTILPPVALTRFPTVRRVKALALAPHCRPLRFRRDEASVGGAGGLSAPTASPFIYTPIYTPSAAAPPGDAPSCFWVEGDACEVSLELSNPLPFQLEVDSLTLLTEGPPMMGRSVTSSLHPGGGAASVRLPVTPQGTGLLAVMGYVCEVMGVRSVCRLRDVRHLAEVKCVATVVPALPLLQVSTSLSPAETFCSLPDAEYVVATGSLAVRAGQRAIFSVTLSNQSRLAVHRLDLYVDSDGIPPRRISELIRWDEAGLQAQMPISPGGLVTIDLEVTGMTDFLTGPAATEVSSKMSSDEREDRFDWRRHLSFDSGGAASVELVLLMQYGGSGEAGGYCRQCGVSLFVDILPVVELDSWRVLELDRQRCRLVLDAVNVCGQEVELFSEGEEAEGKGKRLGVVGVGERAGLEVVVARCDLRKCRSDAATTGLGSACIQLTLAAHLSSTVRLRWSIPSRSSLSGAIFLSALHWTATDVERLQTSPVHWCVKVNEVEVSSDTAVESLRCHDGVSISVSARNVFGVEWTGVSLRVNVCRTDNETIVKACEGAFWSSQRDKESKQQIETTHCDNSHRSNVIGGESGQQSAAPSSVESNPHSASVPVSERAPADARRSVCEIFASNDGLLIGCAASQFDRLLDGADISHACSFLFLTPGIYRLSCVCVVSVATDLNGSQASGKVANQKRPLALKQWDWSTNMEVSYEYRSEEERVDILRSRSEVELKAAVEARQAEVGSLARAQSQAEAELKTVPLAEIELQAKVESSAEIESQAKIESPAEMESQANIESLTEGQSQVDSAEIKSQATVDLLPDDRSLDSKSFHSEALTDANVGSENEALSQAETRSDDVIGASLPRVSAEKASETEQCLLQAGAGLQADSSAEGGAETHDRSQSKT